MSKPPILRRFASEMALRVMLTCTQSVLVPQYPHRQNNPAHNRSSEAELQMTEYGWPPVFPASEAEPGANRTSHWKFVNVVAFNPRAK